MSPLADAAGASLGGWARSLLLAGASISMFGYLGGMTLSMPRMLFALARDGFLPRAPGGRASGASLAADRDRRAVDPHAGARHHRAPSRQLAILANVSALALYLGCALAAWRLRQRGVGGAGGGIRMPAAGVVPWLACAVIVWLLTGVTSVEWLGFVICVAVASLIYNRQPRRALAVTHSLRTRRHGDTETFFQDSVPGAGAGCDALQHGAFEAVNQSRCVEVQNQSPRVT